MEPTDLNRRAWDEVHRRRAEVMADQLGIPEAIVERMPDLAGRHVLHLQCATGEATLELKGRGAMVTGVDISGEALAVARERVPDAVFVQADVHSMPVELLRGRFDLVFTGGGVLVWLHDLDAWASGIATALKPGGELFLYDMHPVALCLDEVTLRWRDDYFDERPIVEVGWSHFPLPGEPAQEQKLERFWRLGQVVTAVAASGLVVRSLEEVPSAYEWKRLDKRVPSEFVLRAEKPSV